jgi:hypothetical protein
MKSTCVLVHVEIKAILMKLRRHCNFVEALEYSICQNNGELVTHYNFVKLRVNSNMHLSIQVSRM